MFLYIELKIAFNLISHFISQLPCEIQVFSYLTNLIEFFDDVTRMQDETDQIDTVQLDSQIRLIGFIANV